MPDWGSIGHTMLGALSGGTQQTNYSVDDQGQMQQTQTPLKAGQMFKNMLAGMLTGLSGGVEANANGMHGGLGAFAGGAAANFDRLQKQTQMQKQAAIQQGQRKQQATAQGLENQERMGRVVNQQLQNGIDAFKMAGAQSAVSTDQAQRFNQLSEMIEGHPGAESLGFYKDDDSLYSEEKNVLADITKNHTQARVFTLPHIDPATNKVVGVQLYKLPTSYLEQLNDKPLEWDTYKTDARGVVHTEQVKLPPGSMKNGDYLTLRSKMPQGAVTPAELEKDQNALKVQSMKDDVMTQRVLSQQNMMQERFLQAMQMASEKGEVLSDDDLKKAGQMVGHYDVDANKLRFTRGNLIKVLEYAKIANPDYSDQTYESARHAMQSMASGNDHMQLLAADKALNHNMDLRRLVEKMPYSGDVKALNSALQTAARQMGKPEFGSIDVLKTALKEELAKSTKGGTPDINLEKQFDEVFSTKNGHKMLLSALDQAAQVTQQNVSAVAEQAGHNIPGFKHMPNRANLSLGAQESLASRGLENPLDYGAFPKPIPGETQQAPDWVLQRALKTAQNDPKRALQLMQQNGWSQ